MQPRNGLKGYFLRTIRRFDSTFGFGAFTKEKVT
jgi:hypothetical protein